MRRALLFALVTACDDGTTVFTTVQPAGVWIDAVGTQVTSGPDLEFIDSRGVVWALDWRTGQPTPGARYPRQIFSVETCRGAIYAEATVPPLHAISNDAGDLFLVKPSAHVQALPQAWTDDGPGCTRVADGTIVYRIEDVIPLRGAPRTTYLAPLRKVLPDEHGEAPAP